MQEKLKDNVKFTLYMKHGERVVIPAKPGEDILEALDNFKKSNNLFTGDIVFFTEGETDTHYQDMFLRLWMRRDHDNYRLYFNDGQEGFVSVEEGGSIYTVMAIKYPNQSQNTISQMVRCESSEFYIWNHLSNRWV